MTPFDDDADWDAACVAAVQLAEAARAPLPNECDAEDEDVWLDAEAEFGNETCAVPERRQLDLRAWLGLAPRAKKAKTGAVQADIRALFGAPVPPPEPVVAAPRRCPFYKRIEGTPFAVDAFGYGAVPGVQAYILTHFHSDHYGGLDKHWPAHLPIYCTPVTDRLVALRLRVPPAALRPVPLNTRTLVLGVPLTFLDANHCPGAAVALLQPASLPPSRPFILHTGDFRAAPSLLGSPQVTALAHRISLLYLDTTYCDERYAFPPQEEAVAAAVAAALRARGQHRRLLIVVGAYSIGKERVALALAEALDCAIFVEASRAQLYACFDWPALQARLTRQREGSPLHVVPLGWCASPAKLAAYLEQQNQGAPPAYCYDAILGFRPTGWTHGQAPRKAGKGVSVEGVAYSEHSSARELAACVRLLQPGRVIPTVSVGNAGKREAMAKLLAEWQAA